MTVHVVAGARGRSLMGSLAALGLVRVLGTQADRALRCHINGSDLVVDTEVDDLAAWLVDSYVPTPILSPWNEGSGYGTKDRVPKQALARLVSSGNPRFEPFRASHDRIAPLAAQCRAEGWDKRQLVAEVRSVCPDAMLPWLDAAVVVLDKTALEKGRLAFPPLLGSGGNDGRLDFSTNFHQRLLDVIGDDATRGTSLALAADWLQGSSSQPLVKAAAGQFDPGAAGTPNSSPYGSAESVVNPWQFVLMIEGSLLFASAAARRLDTHTAATARVAMTFSTAGSEFANDTGSAAEESRGEIWGTAP